LHTATSNCRGVKEISIKILKPENVNLTGKRGSAATEFAVNSSTKAILTHKPANICTFGESY